MTLGKLISLHKKRQGYTFEIISQKTGLSQGYLCDIAKDRRMPSPKNLQKISKCLKIPQSKVWASL